MPDDPIQHGLRLDPIDPEAPPISLKPDHPATIGRSLQCDVTLAAEAISRRHLELVPRGGRWLVSDLGSRHGTYLNGLRLAPNESTVLGNGDRVQIGPYTYTCLLYTSYPSDALLFVDLVGPLFILI